jgi:hypothetical protein
MVSTLPTGQLLLDQWHNTLEVTNSTARRKDEAYFWHDNCWNCVKMRQVRQGAVGLCEKIIPKLNNWAACNVVTTVIQIMSMT